MSEYAVKGSRLAIVAITALLLALATTVACDLDTDFADNLVERTAERNKRRLVEQERAELPLPDPEGAPYLSPPVQEMEIDEAFGVDLIDDLVIGEGHTGPEYLFARFSGRSLALASVAVDAAGRIYVLDTRSSAVRVFDPEGEFLLAFGQRGQGPGDFEGPFALEVAGERVHVFHRRFFASIWDLRGNFERDRAILRTPEAQEAERLEETTRGTMATTPSEARRRDEARRFRTPLQVLGRPDGSMITVYRERPTEQTGRISTPFTHVVGQLEDGVEKQRFIEVPEWAQPTIAAAPDGGVYVGMFGHLRTTHYTLALDAGARPRWVLITPWDVDLPPNMVLRVDPRGRLYAFPNFYADVEQGSSPVRVYTSEGELVGAGYLNRRPSWQHWQTTAADRVFGVRRDAVSDEWQVVRYRLEINAH